MKQFLLIACGNPLRSDDGMAHELVRQLELGNNGILKNVEIESAHQLTPEMAESASRVSRVIIVDAEAGGEVGKVRVQKIEPSIAEQVPSGLSHDFDPETLLNTTRSLFNASPEVFVVSIGAQNFDHGELLSTEVSKAIPEALNQVKQLLQESSLEGKPHNA